MAYPTLNPNLVTPGFNNQIIGISLLDRFGRNADPLFHKIMEEGTLFGDTKEYRSISPRHSRKYVQYSPDAIDFIKVNVNKTGRTQPVVVDQFFISETTLDSLCMKQAWMNDGQYSDYIGLINKTLNDEEYMHDFTTINCLIGASNLFKTSVGKQAPAALSLTTGKEGQEIAEFLANLTSDMCTPSFDYNDYGDRTLFTMDRLYFIWNSKWVNKIEKINLPVIFHKDGVMDNFAKYVIDAKYWGDAQKFADISAGTVVVGKPIKKTGSVYTYEPDASETMVLRCVESCEITCTDGVTVAEFEAGDILMNPVGKVLDVSDYDEKFYVENDKYILKVLSGLPPYLASTESTSEAYNPKNHSTNRYLVFGRNTLARILAEACVTIKSA